MDLSDVFVSFGQTNNKPDETISESKQKGLVRHYVFGTVIKNGDFPCYKIEKGGRITAYMSFVHPGLNKQIIYESKLVLNEQKKMDNIEIIAQSSSKEKRQLSEAFNHQIQTLRKEKDELVTKIQKLEQQNKALQESFLSLQKNSIQIAKQIKFNTIKLVKENILEQFREQLMDKIKETKQQIKSEVLNLNSKAINQFKQNSDNRKQFNATQIKRIQAQFKSSSAQIQKRFNQYILMQGLPQMYLGKFSIPGYQSKYIGQTSQWTQILFNKFIPYSQTFTFKIKIIKTATKNIMIGVVSYQNAKQQRYSYNTGYANCYYSASCCKYPSGSGEGSGFSQGQVVQVNVQRSNKTVRWFVNGSQMALDGSFNSLADQAKIFVPYVQLFTTGDIIEWIP